MATSTTSSHYEDAGLTASTCPEEDGRRLLEAVSRPAPRTRKAGAVAIHEPLPPISWFVLGRGLRCSTSRSKTPRRGLSRCGDRRRARRDRLGGRVRRATRTGSKPSSSTCTENDPASVSANRPGFGSGAGGRLAGRPTCHTSGASMARCVQLPPVGVHRRRHQRAGRSESGERVKMSCGSGLPTTIASGRIRPPPRPDHCPVPGPSRPAWLGGVEVRPRSGRRFGVPTAPLAHFVDSCRCRRPRRPRRARHSGCRSAPSARVGHVLGAGRSLPITNAVRARRVSARRCWVAPPTGPRRAHDPECEPPHSPVVPRRAAGFVGSRTQALTGLAARGDRLVGARVISRRPTGSRPFEHQWS